jgi:hypothetical protein
MKDMLDDMWRKYNLLEDFRQEMLLRGYMKKELTYVNAQIDQLKDLIKHPTKILLTELLRRHTNYRLRKIVQGEVNLLDIINCPENYSLNLIDDYKNAWRSKKSLIFEHLNRKIYVFSPVEECNVGQVHIEGKWQNI